MLLENLALEVGCVKEQHNNVTDRHCNDTLKSSEATFSDFLLELPKKTLKACNMYFFVTINNR